MPKLILASQSAGRSAIMEQLGVPFEVMASTYDEDMSAKADPIELAKYLAIGKAREVATRLASTNTAETAIIIGADTFVIHNGKYLGKPANLDAARTMLQQLNGTSHEIMTGLAIIDTASGKEIINAETARIYFRQLTDEEIDAYVATGEPLGKAGSYAVQGIGAKLIEKIEGEESTIQGLPLHLLISTLEELGINL